MKIGGIEITTNEEVLVLPRMEGDIIIKAKSVAVNDEFDALVPEPTPPVVLKKGGKSKDFKDKTYLKMRQTREEQRFAYMVLRSLEPSKIEWEKVDLDKPSTWLGWRKELQDAGMAEVEVNRVTMCVMAANSLDESKIRAAREDFLLGQGE